MDLLSQRYANPCFFLNGMIRTGRFAEFVSKLVDTKNEEKEYQSAWEFYLHRHVEDTFGDFYKSLKDNRNNQQMSVRTIETTVQNSLDILKNFNPIEGGEHTNGTV